MIPSHWALTEETERMAQKNKWKQSNAKITAVRILSGRGDGVDDTSMILGFLLMRAATNGEVGQILPIPLGKAAYRANSCICFSEKDDSSMEGNDW